MELLKSLMKGVKQIEAGFKNVKEEQLEQFIAISRELIEGLGKSSEC